MKLAILSELENLKQKESIIKIAEQLTVDDWKEIRSSLIPDSVSNNNLE